MRKSKSLLTLLSAATIMFATGCATVGAYDTSSAGETTSSKPQESAPTSEESKDSSEKPGPTSESEKPTPSSSSENKSTSSSKGQSTSQNTSTPDKEVYNVVIHAITGVSITSDKKKASEGETVTLTIEESAGYTLLTLTANGKALTVSGGKATFVMPDEDVDVRATAQTTGKITTGGDIAIALKEEGDIYAARNVRVEKNSSFYIKVTGDDGKFTPIGFGSCNRWECYGDISASGAMFRTMQWPAEAVIEFMGNGMESSIGVAGNARYDIIYNPANSEHPVTVRRVEVLEVPESEKQLQALFASPVAWHISTPKGVTGVSYYDSRTNDQYSWKLYNNNTSLATITNKETGDVSHVYKEVKNGVYTEIDDYIESRRAANPYPDGRNNMYIDDTESAKEDTEAKAGKYQIIDGEVQYEDAFKAYKRSKEQANWEVESGYSHNLYSLDRMLHEGYRTGYVIEDDLVDAGREFSGEKNSDGSFTVNVKSFKTYKPNSSGSTYARMQFDIRIEYTLALSFTKDGAPLTGSFTEQKYTETEYDFTKMTYKAGKEGKGLVVKQCDYAYTYGEKTAPAEAFNKTPYLANRIEASIKGKKGTNVVESGWRSDSGAEPVQIKVYPSTALDAWQYGIIESSDNEIIGPTEHDPKLYQVGGTKAGKVNLTFGNHVDRNVTCVTEIEARMFMWRSVYLLGDIDDFHYNNANSIQLNAGTAWSAKMDTSTTAGGPLADMTFTYSVDGIITCSVDPVTRMFTVDARAATITQKTSVTIYIDSPYRDTSWSQPTISCTVYPSAGKPATRDGIVGTYGHEFDEGSADVDSRDASRLNMNADGTGTFYDDEKMGGTGNTYSFKWSFDENAQNFKITDVAITSFVTPNKWNHVRIYIMYEPLFGKLGVAIVAEKWSFGGETDGNLIDFTSLMGNFGYTEDYDDVYPVAYEFFAKIV